MAAGVSKRNQNCLDTLLVLQKKTLRSKELTSGMHSKRLITVVLITSFKLSFLLYRRSGWVVQKRTKVEKDMLSLLRNQPAYSYTSMAGDLLHRAQRLMR